MGHLVRFATVVALFAVAAACGGKSSVPATPTQAPAPASQTAPSAPTAPARAPSLKQVADIPFPPDTEMLVLEGSDDGHGGWFHLKRYVRHGNTSLESTNVLTRPEGATLTGVARTSSGRLIASECVGTECNYEGGPKSVVSNFLSSTDDGATWNAIGSRPGEWWLAAADGEGALAYQTDSTDATPQFISVPGMSAVTPPPGTNAVIFYGGDRMLWSESDAATLVDSAGDVVAHYDLGIGNHSIYSYSESSGTVAALVREQRGTGDAVSLLALFHGGAAPANVWLAPGIQVLGPWLTDHTIAVTAAYGTFNGAACGTGPAIIDTTAGTIAFIRDPFATPDCIHVPRVQSLLWAGSIQ